jgi:hypothetical protein
MKSNILPHSTHFLPTHTRVPFRIYNSILAARSYGLPPIVSTPSPPNVYPPRMFRFPMFCITHPHFLTKVQPAVILTPPPISPGLHNCRTVFTTRLSRIIQQGSSLTSGRIKLPRSPAIRNWYYFPCSAEASSSLPVT